MEQYDPDQDLAADEWLGLDHPSSLLRDPDMQDQLNEQKRHGSVTISPYS